MKQINHILNHPNAICLHAEKKCYPEGELQRVKHGCWRDKIELSTFQSEEHLLPADPTRRRLCVHFSMMMPTRT